jgi:CheY-like chemotaxis protein
MTTCGTILLVEDNEDDVFLMTRALNAAHIENPMSVVEDGQQAVDYLSGAGPFADRDAYPLPVIVFLDLKLPIMMGLEVLAWIRADPKFADIIVVVLTSSNEPSDLKEAYRLGANSYVVKPPDADQLLEMARAFKWYWLKFNKFHTAVA